MSSTSQAAALPVVIDLAAERLRIGERTVALRPKTWEVLRALVERPGELLSKDELLDRVWAGTAVSEGTLNKSIGELRAVLGESSQTPRWIETVSRRGFRWIGEARIVPAHGSDHRPVAPPESVVARQDPVWTQGPPATPPPPVGLNDSRTPDGSLHFMPSCV
jgi:DNA-binding winged helix-turn-helix (wHTH) protein